MQQELNAQNTSVISRGQNFTQNTDFYKALNWPLEYKAHDDFNSLEVMKNHIRVEKEIPHCNLDHYCYEDIENTGEHKKVARQTLSVEQEQAAFKVYNFYKMHWLKLRNSMKDQDSWDNFKAKKLIRRFHQAIELRNKISEYNLGFVKTISSKLYDNKWATFDEVVQIGNIALLKAIDKFTFSIGNKFSTYCQKVIYNAIIREYGKAQNRKKYVVDGYCGMPNMSDQRGHPSQPLNRLEILQDVLSRNLAGLTADELTFLKTRYNLASSDPGKEKTYKELSSIFGKKSNTLSTYDKRIKEKLKQAILKYGDHKNV